MLDSPTPAATARDKLVSLLDYVEQVVRLDERVAFDLADYKLADGKPARFVPCDTAALPGVTHDGADEHGPVWLAVERLARSTPPDPPADLAPWIAVSPDPVRAPEVSRERTVVVDEPTRLDRIAAGACATSFVEVEAEAAVDAEPPAPTWRQTLRLAEQATTESRLTHWVAESWMPWAALEGPRRRTIALYEKLYRLQQQLELGGAEAPIEIVWGIGVVRWVQAGRRVERPLIERAVDIELDDSSAGVIRVRPTVADATVDLKPYDDLGVQNLALLDAFTRREIDRAATEEGLSPFRRTSFEPILSAAAVRLQPDGAYRPGETPEPAGATLAIDDQWVLFARPRSGHVLLADIDRLKTAARDLDRPIEGLALRLVTDPSMVAGEAWAPLSGTLGASAAPETTDEPVTLATDVFFPKPFNDDQVAMVRRLARADGLVVQGPPGTGKTHTIANLICHAMATGQRVLVVSRGEAALAVLREQLPDKVRPLAIALLSNEREGLGQVEAAIRAVQTVVEGSRPDIRHSAIRRCEAEIVKLRQRLAAVDDELDGLAAAEGLPLGPRDETPAMLARRIAASRDAFAWFTDRPLVGCTDSGMTDAELRDLAEARRRVGDLLDHRHAALPAPADLPTPDAVAGWHSALLGGGGRERQAGEPPMLMVAPADVPHTEALVEALEALAASRPLPPWLARLCAAASAGRHDAWGDLLAALALDWDAVTARRAAIAAQAVDIPPALLDDPEARGAVERGARGERPFALLTLGKAASKGLVAAIRLRGAALREGDREGWGHVRARIEAADAARGLDSRWRAFVEGVGAPTSAPLADLDAAAAALRQTDAIRCVLADLPGLRAAFPQFEELTHPPAARAVAEQVRRAMEAARIAGVRATAAHVRALFEAGESRTATMVRRFFDDILGRPDVDDARIAATWRGLRQHCERLHDHAADFATIAIATRRIAVAGAPAWANRLASEPARDGADPLLPADWREVWDLAFADGLLARRGTGARLTSLANQRTELDRNCQRLFVDLVRERTYYALERRLSPSVKSALVEFVRALGRLGKGTGRGAGRQRRLARDAMRRCYDAVPCWIMPTWRVVEQLPADLAAFDLVILDEASQSDVTELPAILRGRKLLVVGDDRQVSPMAPFVAQARIDAMRRRHLRGLPFQALLEPGESLYTLMQAVFPDERLMLKEHFRCVEPIIRFSMRFYPEALLPLRIPSLAERLDPPLIDIFVPHGRRDKTRKINMAEAEIIVAEIGRMVTDPAFAGRSIGVISLIGGEQAEFVRARLSEALGAEIMQRHKILCGDSATFQGNERDVVFLSMVADGTRRTTLTMLRYAQRFNVAMSRGRDRVVLVRSVRREDLNPVDLKAKLIQHFEQPMPALAETGDDPLARCDSDFERAVMRALLARGYRVTPQVGALGFRIDMVVEGDGGRRLAVECDGDAFHGPERWREDMRRQRVLERVGWRFWRCFASTFYADPDGTLVDLVDTLTRAGIEPSSDNAEDRPASAWVEHRVAPPPVATGAAAGVLSEREQTDSEQSAATNAATSGSQLTLVFADDRKPVSVLLTEGAEDWSRGLVSTTSVLGKVLVGREADEEVELPFGIKMRKAVIERVVQSD